jgi:hypothetical protein
MRQPSGSKIQLNSKADRLELQIPARLRLDRSATHQLVVTSIMNLVTLVPICLSIYVVVIGFTFGLVALLPLILMLGKSAWRMSFDFADEFLLQTKIVIDRQQFTLSQHLYSLDRGRPKQLKTREISQVIIDSYQVPDKKVQKVTLILELRQTDPVRILSTGQDLTEREIKWLGAELSKWLGVNLYSEAFDLGDRS